MWLSGFDYSMESNLKSDEIKENSSTAEVDFA